MTIFSRINYWDFQIEKTIFSWRTDFYDCFFRFITWFGEWWLIGALVILSIGIFLFYKQKKFIRPLIVSVFGSAVLTVIIKYLVNRSRPGPDLALYVERLPSFPSAHSALVLSFFGFWIFLILKSKVSYFWKTITVIILLFIIIAVGFSRLYLGVHFPSDVLAGYLVGLMWLLIAMYLARNK